MLTLVVVTLAVWQAVEIYHHSDLFSETRAWFEAWGGFLGGLSKCPWCLSVHVGVVFAGYFLLTSGTLWSVPIWGLAVSRLANVANDLMRDSTHTQSEEPESLPIIDQK